MIHGLSPCVWKIATYLTATSEVAGHLPRSNASIYSVAARPKAQRGLLRLSGGYSNEAPIQIIGHKAITAALRLTTLGAVKPRPSNGTRDMRSAAPQKENACMKSWLG